MRQLAVPAVERPDTHPPALSKRREPRRAHPRKVVRALLSGLNELLKLGDFARGDVYRD